MWRALNVKNKFKKWPGHQIFAKLYAIDNSKRSITIHIALARLNIDTQSYNKKD